MLNPKETALYDRTWMSKARMLLGMNQVEAAKACELSVGYYNRIEQGVQLPNVKTGLGICKILGVSPENWLVEKRIA